MVRGAPVSFLVLLALGTMLAPRATAQPADSPPAVVDPPLAAPGQTLHLLFTPTRSGALDVGVERSATCAIRAPDGSTISCESQATLAVVRASPGDTTYSWDLPAPAQPGNYTVLFHESALVSLPAAPADARAEFRVGSAATPAPLGEPLAKDSAGATGVDPTPGAAATAGAAPRLVLSSTSAAGALVLLLLAHRFGS